ncbi:tetraacyldisaccharide 4'-kinase [Sulfuriferula nivalis]|uniref:Tetraacyldisaccharide 4'-kinase n=1 Tax=Sulfuriferula nivalis TaxID=2675298 RepID=A0A809RQZ4_9PROT|nr:tetraacyldisaccharide 4'-kinase [Sulfuriferula nivalis]BBP01281.1 tetraacyldisaccharide 4'-kinase [Sulfuriferula nivalis]
MVAWLQRQWLSITIWHVLLIPLSWLFLSITRIRQLAYKLRLSTSYRLPVPVIVVGNINVGGTGKTPLVIYLVQQLRQHGWRPGIISRGYGGTATTPTAVNANSDPSVVGDEPLLIAQRAGCPLWVDRNRPAAAHALLSSHPEVNIIISDDGLQHYALERDINIAVIDGARGFGNKQLLPAGPLREPLARLSTMDAIVINQTGAYHTSIPPTLSHYAMHLQGHQFTQLLHPQRTATAQNFINQPIHAVAGIGNPNRFFDQLSAMGLTVIPHAFPDHHQYQAGDFNFTHSNLSAIIIMTEKDAVKCHSFADERMWVWAVDAHLPDTFIADILTQLGNHHG